MNEKKIISKYSIILWRHRSVASIFGGGSVLLVEDELLIGALLDLAWVHLPLLVEH